MTLDLDGAVNGYVWRMISSLFFGPGALFNDDENDRSREEIFISILQIMVWYGQADHIYDRARDTDVFNSTDFLIQNWDWIFNGDKFDIDRSERIVIDVPGKRSRYFNKRWQAEVRRGRPIWWRS
jgi:hypothetical protein